MCDYQLSRGTVSRVTYYVHVHEVRRLRQVFEAHPASLVDPVVAALWAGVQEESDVRAGEMLDGLVSPVGILLVS